ncbi:metallophosphoesterase [Vibrio splendidus]
MNRSAIYSGLLLTFSATHAMSAEHAELRLIGTSDLHSYMDNFDYYANERSEKYGAVNLVAEIEHYRNESDNSVLADTGDLLVGNPFGDFIGGQWLAGQAKTTPIIDILNELNFDVAAPGNHDFDYGLEYLHLNYDKANFPTVLSNVYKSGSETPYFNPYVIVEKPVITKEGTNRTVKIGYIGVVPPQTMELNAKWLDGKVDIVDPLPHVKKWAAEAKANGADIIVALAHSGMKDVKYYEGMEDMTWHLAQVKDVDAILFGHTHTPFPGKKYQSTANVDNEKGTIFGKPAAQPGKWGDHIGIVDLSLSYDDNAWTITEGSAFVVKSNERSETESQQQKVRQYTANYHKQILTEFSRPLGKVNVELRNDFNLLGNDSVYQIVGDSMISFVENKNITKLPILSAVAPAIHRNDSNFYLALEAGELTTRDVGSLVYSSDLIAKEMTGAELKELLEISASMYVEPNDDSGLLIKPDHLTFLYYNILGIKYKIDITKASTHNSFGFPVAEGEGRITEMTYQDKPIKHNDKFLLVGSKYNPYFARELKAKKEFLNIGDPNSRTVLKEYLQQSQNALDINVENNVTLILEPNKSYRFQANNDKSKLADFVQLTSMHIKWEKEQGGKNVYVIEP